ncbi:isoleucine--tRNA ligase [Candidatus Acetothermia bacterium]|jgi:isoleucyl-tRNA synthetase|nr:isoleucine--tRNA ligase [Candidatus Acetothermia bacterium]MCI2426955.1 isoleucine--tRNA ligase [Candidatus Acetothermia bacterium]MCI2428523.1 isoleucine--tRNA ligase [Candidatus Acetothermia bacterium]
MEYKKLTSSLHKREEALLKFWKEENIFQRSLEQTQNCPRYVFYEGPPTANGRPHIGHLIPRVYKDLFPRYKTMQGFYVTRKGGWDTHGLPVELEVEKEIGINSKQEIETYGIENFVNRCKESVWRYKGDWERMIERMGFWIDLENAYITCTDDYIESVWWQLAQMFTQGLLYQGHKVLPYCSRCGTGLSSHEVAQGYKEVEDPSLFLRMPLVSDRNARYNAELPGKTSLLTWTTTPWTLPANIALAVSPVATYAEVELQGERLILARALLGHALDSDYTLIREFPGSDLVGLSYEPPYRAIDAENAYRVYAADFVNIGEGTGIVHAAPAFGEDDYQLGQRENLPFFNPVNLSGEFTDAFPLCAGRFVKQADPMIIDDLQRRGILYCTAGYKHDYPFCWRCDTPLIYYAMDSWYIRTTAVKREMISNNQRINWHPEHIGTGRLADFLVNLKDWALSRDRYWGTPLNLWVCNKCDRTIAIGSRKELVEQACDAELARTVEFHRPYIDAVKLVCSQCKGEMQRVPNVIDAWFDSGCMHTAQWHYPFENQEKFRENFPADFICEGIDQTRGWFYTLLATGTIIHGQAPFKNCIGTGLGLDENELKMSKSKGNVIDPWELIDLYGADCLRWYLYSSSAPWRSKRLVPDEIKEPLYRFLSTLRNTYDFFALYASIDSFDPHRHQAEASDLTSIDHWIISRLHTTINRVSEELNLYHVPQATEAMESFLDELSNWYIRSSRRRFWGSEMTSDKVAAYTTLYQVLVAFAQLLAPFIPFIAEEIYHNLQVKQGPPSVHLCPYPCFNNEKIDRVLESEMVMARQIVTLGHRARNRAQIKVRQPLSQIIFSDDSIPLRDEVIALIKAELNVEQIVLTTNFDHYYTYRAEPNFATLGPRLGRIAQQVGVLIKTSDGDQLRDRLSRGPIELEVEGAAIEITAADVVFSPVLPASFVAAEENGVQLLLDTTLDERLVEAGLVRELIHTIQRMRKDAGFEVTDRIVIAYDAEGMLCAIMEKNSEVICKEVLATRCHANMIDKYEYQADVAINDHRVQIRLSRCR